MGYFSNGSEGEAYEYAVCERCVHFDQDGESYCPVMGLHALYNYEQHEDADGGDYGGTTLATLKAEVLGEFIPRTKDGLSNELCKMFVPIANVDLSHLERVKRLENDLKEAKKRREYAAKGIPS